MRGRKNKSLRRRFGATTVSALEQRTLLSGAYAAIDLYPLTTPSSATISPEFAAAQQVVGEAFLPANSEAALWTGPQSLSILQPATVTNSFAYGVSGNQQVGMGYGGAVGPNSHAFLWTGTAASAVNLNPSQLGSIESIAMAVSGNQQVGYFNPGPGNQEHAVLWNGTAASAVSLQPSFASNVSQARATDGVHQVGFSDGVSGHVQAVLWSGTAASAVNLAPGGSFYESYAMAVAGNEQAGYANATATTAFLWHGTAASAVNLGTDAASIGLTVTQAFGTNGTQEVGWGSSNAPMSQVHALLWSGTAASITDLQQYLPANFTASRAYSIDANGNIFGEAQDSSGSYHAVEWTQAPNFVVNTTADETVANDATLSLREAIAQANALPANVPATITFDPNVFAPGTLHTITLGGTQLEINHNLTLDGPGTGVLAVSGNSASRVFQVDPGVNVSLSGMTVTGGNETDGGGIYINGGTLQLTTVNIQGNHAALVGGGIYSNGGSLTVGQSSFSSNTATGVGATGGSGGAIATTASTVASMTGCDFSNNTVSGGFGTTNAASGGAIFSPGTLTLTSSTFSNNAIAVATNTYGGGAVFSSNSLIATGCTFTGNSSASSAAGAVYVGLSSHATIADSTFTGNHEGTGLTGGGAGAIDSAGFTTISGSTFSGNSGAIGGAVGSLFGDLTAFNCTFYGNSTLTRGGALALGGPNTLTNCTIYGNTAGASGGGIWSNSTTSTTINNTIVAGNMLSAGGASDVFGTVSGSNNLLGTGGAGGLSNGVQGNIVGVANPMLAVLGNYGGPTQTMPPLTGSPAIDAGSNALAVDANGQPLTTDQRGLPRIVNATVDIGAVEGHIDQLSSPNIVSSPGNQSVNAGQTATFTAAATGNPTPTVQWRVSTDGGKTFNNITGATSATLSFTAAQNQDQNQYQAVFTNSQGSATTTAATLSVLNLPTVTTNPSNQNLSSGGTATFTAAATGNPTPTVQWQVSTDGGKTFNNITGATSATLNFTAAQNQDQNQYRAVFTNSQGSSTTAAATLTVTSSAAGLTIFGNTTPPQQNVNDPLIPASGGAEVGLKFQSDVVGVITAIRFFKGNLDTGVHTGELWTSGGTLLATATFTNETASGWQTITLSHSVVIEPHSTYLVSYHTNAAYIAYTRSGLANAGVDTPPLHVLMNSSSDHNGVYKYGPSAFPTVYNNQAPNYWVDVVFNPVTPSNILGTNAPPGDQQNVNDPLIVQNGGAEVGMKFSSDAAGWVVGVRFYKGTLDTGAHTGELWDSAGNLLATATFTNETASGWQTVTFSNPVAISANTVYIVSYHTNAAYIAYTRNGLASTIGNGLLHVFANGVHGSNGVYKYGSSGFPNIYNGQEPDYWVDVLFLPGA
ncbi:MAG TPA: DUF4082 domain-containing protein [Tepidisphaeraceae bacterium]|jgi:CSLREA domain-containing protein